MLSLTAGGCTCGDLSKVGLQGRILTCNWYRLDFIAEAIGFVRVSGLFVKLLISLFSCR
jgi:hypothetical protein